MNATDSLFVTSILNGDSRWRMTLPVYASVFLGEVERMFGQRDPSFTLVGIEIDETPGSFPRLWYPDSGIAPDDSERRSRHVIIRLSRGALTDPVRARWQLAHECFHLLDPWNQRVDGRPTNWLEEGLASWYQNNRVPEAASREGSYAVAEGLVSPLMRRLPLAVRRLRQERRMRIDEITPGVLRDYCLGAGEEVLQHICEPFHHD